MLPLPLPLPLPLRRAGYVTPCDSEVFVWSVRVPTLESPKEGGMMVERSPASRQRDEGGVGRRVDLRAAHLDLVITWFITEEFAQLKIRPALIEEVLLALWCNFHCPSDARNHWRRIA